MDAGAVAFDDREAATRARSLKSHGRTAHFSHAAVGYNARMPAMAASWLLRACARSERFIGPRRATLAGYRERLEPAAGRARVVSAPSGVDGNGYLCVVESTRDDGAEIAGELERRGIGTGRAYPAPVHDQPAAAGALSVGLLENSSRFCRRVLNLPLYYGIDESDWHRSADTLLGILEV
jgi:dTDP-4-amino-4,6-dideoxygalactose transaminase